MALLEPGTPVDLARRTAAAFVRVHGRPPVVVGRAPGRVNLIGEHTDYNGGPCLPLALPHATYAAVAGRSDDEVHVVSAQTAGPWHGTLSGLGPGQVDGWPAYVAGVLWALREDGLDVPGMDLAIDSTVPFGAGLSSSAAVECAVAVAVTGLLGLPLDRALRRRVVAACVRAESEVAGAPTGGMDQTVSMLAAEGTALLIDFADGTTTEVPLPLGAADLVLLVTDTRVSHLLNDGGYAARRADCEAAAAALGVPTLRTASPVDVEALEDTRLRRRARHVVTETARVEDTVAALRAGDWAEVGVAFAASHASLRDDFEVSCAELDLAVGTALDAGALAARLTGGGFGGSSVAVVSATRLDTVVAAIDAAFDAAGYGAPVHLLALPGGPAGAVSPAAEA